MDFAKAQIRVNPSNQRMYRRLSSLRRPPNSLANHFARRLESLRYIHFMITSKTSTSPKRRASFSHRGGTNAAYEARSNGP